MGPLRTRTRLDQREGGHASVVNPVGLTDIRGCAGSANRTRGTTSAKKWGEDLDCARDRDQHGNLALSRRQVVIHLMAGKRAIHRSGN